MKYPARLVFGVDVIATSVASPATECRIATFAPCSTRTTPSGPTAISRHPGPGWPVRVLSSLHRLLGPVVCSLLLVGSVCSAGTQTSGVAKATLDFRLQFNLPAYPDLQLKLFPFAISGTLNGAGDHSERWGLHERGENPNDPKWPEPGHGGPYEVDYEPDPFLAARWGENYGTEALVTKDLFAMALFTEATAFAAPNSFAWAKTTVPSGTIAKIFNPTSTAQNCSFTIFYDRAVDVSAVAEPGGHAFAETDWDFALSTFSQFDEKKSLVYNKGYEQRDAELGPSRNNVFRVSAVFNDFTHEGTYALLIDPDETVEIHLDRATLYTQAIATVPEPGTFGVFAMIGLGIVIGHRLRASRKGHV